MKFLKNFKVVLLVSAVFSAMSFAACNIGAETPTQELEIITTPDIETTTLPDITIGPTETTPDETTPAETTTTVEETTNPGEGTPYEQAKSYLTGEWVSVNIARRRPIAVILSNIITAVPQSGIENAAIVYETPVEGGITRLVGIFEDYDALDKIGSVRSARLYHVYIALEYDAIFAHYGSAIYADNLLAENFVHNLSGLAGEGTVTYYRDDSRKAPHNAYTSKEGIDAGIDYMNYRNEYDESYAGHFKFAADDSKVVLSNGVDATYVSPGYVNNSPWFEYNESDEKYYRFQYGGEQIDEATGNQLAYTNIIFQAVDYYDYGDGYYYIYNQGSGAGKYITGGKCIDITWEKADEFGITKYYDASGQEITLNQGKTWISFIFNTNTSKIVVK